jgi:hypothetical protein
MLSHFGSLPCLTALAVAGASQAQTYPDGNVRIVVPYPAGGANRNDGTPSGGYQLVISLKTA